MAAVGEIVLTSDPKLPFKVFAPSLPLYPSAWDRIFEYSDRWGYFICPFLSILIVLLNLRVTVGVKASYKCSPNTNLPSLSHSHSHLNNGAFLFYQEPIPLHLLPQISPTTQIMDVLQPRWVGGCPRSQLSLLPRTSTPQNPRPCHPHLPQHRLRPPRRLRLGPRQLLPQLHLRQDRGGQGRGQVHHHHVRTVWVRKKLCHVRRCRAAGVVYRALRDILGGGVRSGVFVQLGALEIFNEEIYDLLRKRGTPKVRLEVMGKKAKNATYISGNEAWQLSKEVARVEKQRTVRSTLCNERSSGSHCMIILDVPSVGGRLVLVDMAGSLNIEQAGQTGLDAKIQTTKINKGNIALKRVVQSMTNGDSHIPFRDSKLTMLLQDSFEDDKSKILMVLCESQCRKSSIQKVDVASQGTLGRNVSILNSGSMTENCRKKRGTGDIPGKPSHPWGPDARVSVSVQKRLTQRGPSDETGSSSKKKKNKWTDEDMELKATVQKCGEGNRAGILKQDFKHNRTASQLSQQENRNGNWVQAIPSAPVMLENMEHSVVEEPLCLTLERRKSSLELELGGESKSITSVIPLQQSVDTLLPIMEETMATGAPFEVELKSQLNVAKKASSSSVLSSRRKSVGSLCGHNDNVRSQLQESDDSERLCMVLFDNVKECEEEEFDFIKKNVGMNRLSLTEWKEQEEESRSISSDFQMQPKLERSPSNELALLNGGDGSVNRVNDADEEPFANSFKDKLTPSSSSGRKLKNFPMSQRSASNDLSVLTEKGQMFSPDIFTPNKENLTPEVSGATRTPESLSKSHDRVLREVISKRVERVPFKCLLENSPSGNNNTFDVALYAPADQAICSPNCMNISEKEDAASGSNKDNLTPKDSSSQKSKRCSSNCPDGIQREEKMEKGAERVPFQSFMDNSTPRSYNVHNSSNQRAAQVVNKAGEEKKTWNIVVDVSCLLDDQSRRSLELLEGLKGTHLIIPNIVMRELDCMKRREGLFTRTRKASSALSWIEVCTVRSSWWIHVQSSSEMLSVAATPPAFPSMQPISGSNVDPSSSKPFSICGSLLDIVSPTAEDHILDCTLSFKKLRNEAQFVILTHSVILRIKALAEGLICEAPNEFHESLVNPYSKRFLWVNSRPRGRTWSTSDEQMAPDENYYHHFQVARKAAKPAEGTKGLNLILPRDFHCEKTNLV